MNDLDRLRVVVAGAGAVGAATALLLARRGARVTLADPAPLGRNASGVAAGMLAPASEVLLDPAARDHYPILKAGRDAWPAFMDGLDAAPSLDRSGALIKAGDPQALMARAAAVGARLEPVADEAARRLVPGLSGAGPWLFTPEDWRLDAGPMLRALDAALRLAGGRRIEDRVLDLCDGQVRLASGESLAADALVLATGAEGPGLTPIKGQIVRFGGAGPRSGPVVRGEGVYVAPGLDGAAAGATMEIGRCDLVIDAAVVARLAGAAVSLLPDLAGAPVRPAAGVRGATADGLPLVGSGASPGVWVARGARRNGWLLAPLIAEVVADALAGRAPGPWAAALDPHRFR